MFHNTKFKSNPFKNIQKHANIKNIWLSLQSTSYFCISIDLTQK